MRFEPLIYLGEDRLMIAGEERDSNPRPPGPQPGALTS